MGFLWKFYNKNKNVFYSISQNLTKQNAGVRPKKYNLYPYFDDKQTNVKNIYFLIEHNDF